MDGKAWTCYTQSNTGSQGGTKDFKTPSTKCTEGPSHAPNGAVFNLVKPAKYVEFATWGRTNVNHACIRGVLQPTPYPGWLDLYIVRSKNLISTKQGVSFTD